MTNRLARETSPYLRQHADNPVDWYPWGEEALCRARTEDKPIFLSIGYSACHWCHVMAHESFEDERIAELLNSHFVCIKVDREERPDIDHIYMTVVQALTGGGGWPMSVFLTPEGNPFYGGTYFPPVQRHGMPSFSQLLLALASAWRNHRQDLIAGSQRLVTALRQEANQGEVAASGLQSDTLRQAFKELGRSFDWKNGGWGSYPKFPQPAVVEFLLRFYCLSQEATALQMALRTLEAMARGGLYDQLGGGFHRYSTDASWTVPHFEKMLYDNAQLARVYLHAWQITGDPLYKSVSEETLDYVDREMQGPAGGFHSSQDADSEGEEGRFYLWTLDEVREGLGSAAGAFESAYSLTREGNFEGSSILRFVGQPSQRPSFAPARRQLWQKREHRIHPGCDDKVLASWNGLTLAAFAEAATALHRADYQLAAERNADFLRREIWINGRLFHVWRAGSAKQSAFLDDYACLLDGLIELYQTTFDPQWYLASLSLADSIASLFHNPNGGLYDTSYDDEPLIVRPRDLQDNPTPSGNAMAATALLRLGSLAAGDRYVELALGALRPMQSSLAKHPLAFGQWLQALSYALAPTQQIAIVGYHGDDRAQALLSVARSGYHPFRVVAFRAAGAEDASVPLLHNKGLVEDGAAAYVCDSSGCRTPVTEPEALQALLAQQLS
jgi:uncharacterized protein YyaL (SSP411 family)